MDDIFPEEFDRRLRKHHLTIIMFGTNDSAIEEKTSKFQTSAYVPLEEYEKNMEIIINRAKKCSKHVIVMAPHATDEQGRLNYQVEMYGDKAFARLDRSNERYKSMGWRVNERVENAWYRLRICLLRLSTIRKAILRMEFISTPETRTRLETVEISINHGRHSAGEDAVGLPHGH